MIIKKLLAMSVLVAIALTFAACSKSSKGGAAANSATVKEAASHSHEGWWCDEHGVPEDVCALCNPDLVADFKAKKDWCEKHNRPDSQCFICHPEKEAEFAALYEAKFGKKPPKQRRAAMSTIRMQRRRRLNSIFVNLGHSERSEESTQRLRRSFGRLGSLRMT
jgi:cobalt-zinc-cadmium efflux system membrane fusion protein